MGNVLEIFVLDLGGLGDIFEKVPSSATAEITKMNGKLGEEWVTFACLEQLSIQFRED